MTLFRRLALLIVVALLFYFGRMAIFGRAPERPRKETAYEPYVRKPIPPPDPAPPTQWQVSEKGIGPIAMGMRTEAVGPALGGYFKAPFGNDHQGGFRCDHAAWPGAPVGVTVLLRTNQVVGVVVDSGGVTTTTHVEIGNREDWVRNMYQGIEPAEFFNDRYSRQGPYSLYFAPDHDHPDFGVIFDIRDSVVVSYRAGEFEAIQHKGACR